MKMSTKIYLRVIICFLLVSFSVQYLKAESGYRLWLRYDLISNPLLLKQYRYSITEFISEGNSETISVAEKEFLNGTKGLLGKDLQVVKSVNRDGCIIIGTPSDSKIIASLKQDIRLKELGDEGFLIFSTIINQKKCTIITANKDIGVLYGVFHLLKLIQSQQNIAKLSITSLHDETKANILPDKYSNL